MSVNGPRGRELNTLDQDCMHVLVVLLAVVVVASLFQMFVSVQ